MKIGSIHIEEYELVSKMNLAFRNPSGNPFHPNWEKIEPQCKNILDEIKELETAFAVLKSVGKDYEKLEEAFTHVRDAFCDIKVFAHGAIHIIGAPTDGSFSSEIYVNPRVEGKQLQSREIVAILKTYYSIIMSIIESSKINEGRDIFNVLNTKWLTDTLIEFIVTTTYLQRLLYIEPLKDMRSVIDGVMTRFCRDEDELQETIEKWKNKGVIETYVEGEFPNKIVKSSKDQPDAPKGKFLKSVRYSEPVFEPSLYKQNYINWTDLTSHI